MKDILEKIEKLDNNKLIDVIKNYKQYGYNSEVRNSAIELLEQRGVDVEGLKVSGLLDNSNFNTAEVYYTSFKKSSKSTFIFYAFILIFKFISVSELIERNVFVILLVILFWTALILYFVFFIKSLLDESKFYKAIGKDSSTLNAIVYLFLGLPLYGFLYPYFRRKMKEELKMIT